MIKSDKKFKRKCIICSEYKEKKYLVRFTKEQETSEYKSNKKNKLHGRSFYICKKKECLEKALKSKTLSKYTKLNTCENITKTIIKILNSQKN